MKRGEIWTAAGGKGCAGKPRPVVIVQDDRFDATSSITACPCTSDPAKAPLFRILVEPSTLNGLASASRLMVDKGHHGPQGKDRQARRSPQRRGRRQAGPRDDGVPRPCRLTVITPVPTGRKSVVVRALPRVSPPGQKGRVALVFDRASSGLDKAGKHPKSVELQSSPALAFIVEDFI